ncbi:MAG TPA: type II toxin-antitoxin system VapC family toxin [Rhodocyclaceae bacterium]|nr:type II toxin-antitoxin system VapC family toxin [Rhodocyclaceae bacterium]
MNFAYVVDNSVVTGWWHAGQATEYTRAVRDLIPRSRIHAPQLWTLEFANVLRKLRVTGRLTDADVGAIMAQVGAAHIIVEPQTETAPELLERALRFDLSAYDAAYLGVALRLRLPIACKDGALARAAVAAGVGIFEP